MLTFSNLLDCSTFFFLCIQLCHLLGKDALHFAMLLSMMVHLRFFKLTKYKIVFEAYFMMEKLKVEYSIYNSYLLCLLSFSDTFSHQPTICFVCCIKLIIKSECRHRHFAAAVRSCLTLTLHRQKIFKSCPNFINFSSRIRYLEMFTFQAPIVRIILIIINVLLLTEKGYNHKW